ncbi:MULTISPECIES: T9SS type B sorting domain-containing protein [Chryseobacterium]|uniref:Gliding motility-associated-like protein n=1 Tax=Chryseobacterium geocarposphaerae TaxID=1416776 RepID=A0ABU1LGR4_9FLAO|nr:MULTISPECIES: T9SS type B sorting domain-containing protein [Chryseobacterium]MDR6405750.1 gliding motility-associated-like protein [Chryseobacterium geocarposphaerae]MDR6699087.1 gliding motility-associated-like protein [Chryseobacterium ginsenosidimutans]
MKKQFYFLFLLVFTFIKISAQRDTEHWFAPFSAANLSSTAKQALYLSTDSATPFDVTIYNNNVVLGTVSISKGNPQVYNITAADMIGSSAADLFTVGTKGLYLKGTKPFFATFRFVVPAHGEILTSKGKAGVGTKFYAVVAPITNSTSGMNFTTGILATEDNTTVTVSGYDSAVVFTNGTTATTTPSFSITLNKGQSYIIEGRGNQPGNATGFIGAKITSDKPVSVTNGNFLGEYNIGTPLTGGDIVMDQSVPTDRLGKEFVIVKGYGNISAKTEDVLIVATEDDTEIYVNDNLAPVATIDEGEHYRVNEPNNTNYIDQGSGHYNMYVKTTKNAYVYQLLAGTATSSATIGFNYIPPLNCLLPRKIDEIGNIEMLPQSTNNIKLNILTEKGAAVTVNGVTPTAAQGPYDVTGTMDWVSYSLTGVTGNVTIISTKAVTAGIAGGSGVVGYGGYFAGFSSVPAISKTGDCVPGVVLETGDSFETYQWYLNGSPIPGANTYTYTPMQPGDYTVKVGMGGCFVTTPIYSLDSCYEQVTVSSIVCEAKKTIIPKFTNHTVAFIPSSVQIDVAPTHGTATIDAAGTITYTATPNYVGSDVIVYHFCANPTTGVGCEQVTLNLSVDPNPTVQNASLRACYIESNPSKASFNLESAAVTSQFGVTKLYYPTMADLTNGTNGITSTLNYISSNTKVYVKVTNSNGCFSIAEITLTVLPPVKSTVLTDKIICIENKATLDAGPGFDGYEWNTGATTQAITVPVGAYWVKLKTGECYTTQDVKVFAAEQPVISNLDIKNNTITVTVIGGTAPYKYSLDGVTWQDSNFFGNLPRGENSIYVKDFYNCEPIDVTVTVPNLLNAITPNGDNRNDYIDYSELSYKKNLVFNIFDRYGNKVHQANQFSAYKWDGTMYGKKVPTATYWYEITWTEPNKAQTQIKYSGWILVKNVE